MNRADDIAAAAQALRVSALKTVELAKLIHNLVNGGAQSDDAAGVDFQCTYCGAPLGVADIAGFDKGLKFCQGCVDLTNEPVKEEGDA